MAWRRGRRETPDRGPQEPRDDGPASLIAPRGGPGAGPTIRALACGLAVVGLLCAGPARGRDLPEDSRDLPYYLTGASPMGGAPLFVGLADFDGDGIGECVRVTRAADETFWRLSIDRLLETSRYRLLEENSVEQLGCAGLRDVNADGRPDVALWRQSGDTLSLSCLSVTLESASIRIDTLVAFSWDLAGALLPTGAWRGEVELAGSVDSDHDGTNDAAIVLLQSGIIGRPRGVWLCDLRTGRVLWSVETGANPTGGAFLDDLDGDGRDELVVGLEPMNAPLSYGEWNDLSSRVVALRLDGTVMWSRETGGAGTGLLAQPADLDGDGVAEIVGVVRRPGDIDGPGVILLDGEGRITRTAVDAVSVADAVAADGALFAATVDGKLLRLVLSRDGLIVDRELDCGSPLAAVDRARFEPPVVDQVLFFATTGGELGVASLDLLPLAEITTNEPVMSRQLPFAPGTFAVGDGARRGVAVGTSASLRFLVMRRHPVEAWLVVAVCVVGALGVVTAVPGSRRRASAWVRESITPASERGEIIDGVLEDLRTGGHGKLALTRPIRYLADNLRMLGDQDGGITESFAARYAEMVERARGEGLSNIDRLRRSAERVGLTPGAVAALAAAVRGLRRTLSELSSVVPGEVESQRLADAIDRELVPITKALVAVRRGARGARSASLGACLDAALAPWLVEAEEQGVRVETPDLRSLRSIRVHATARELEYAFDNLTGNALRSLRGKPDPALLVSCVTEASSVRVLFEDNGVGIPAGMQEAVFLMGVSDRRGGGTGLATTRDALSRREGGIRIVRSAPGQGTIFEIRLLTV